MRYTLLLVILLSAISCDSDKPTGPFVPIDPQQLVGHWEGSYSLTYNVGTDSARTIEVAMWMDFTPTTFSFRGDSFGPCATFGQGSYSVEGHLLKFHDESPRTMMCMWENTLNGRFNYTHNSEVTRLRMFQHYRGYLWRVEITKIPVVVPH